MHYFEKQCSYALSLLCLMLLFLPKINLIAVQGRETAGIRIDDLILFSFLLIYSWAHLSSRKSFFDIEKNLFLILAFSALSYFINIFLYSIGAIHVAGSILYVMRLFEYFTFFYAGLLASRFFNLKNILTCYFLINAVFMILQKLGILGGFSFDGYRNVQGRVSGLAAFPSEMGAILNLLFCFLFYSENIVFSKIPFIPRKGVKIINSLFPYGFFLFTGVLIVMTGSRIAILAHVVAFLPFLKKIASARSLSKLTIVVPAIAISGCIIAYAISTDEYAIKRSQGLFSFKNLELAKKVWAHIDLNINPMGNEVIQRSGEDQSWWMRIHKWVYAMKIYATHPETYLQGVGPGFAFAGLDGGILRILVEQGLIGFALFARFFYLIARRSRALWLCLVVFMINMVFFDVYLAYKPMSILFLMAGFSYAEESRIQDKGLHLA